MSQLTPSDQIEQIVEALEAGREQDVRSMLDDLHPVDTARLLESLTPEQRPVVWLNLSDPDRGEILLEVSDGVREDLLQDMDKPELVNAVRELDIDDIADLIPDLPDEILADVLFTVDKEARARLGEVLSYPEDTAGGLMNVDAVAVRENITMRVVIRYLRLRGEIPENTDKLSVVDRKGRLTGVLPVTTVLTAPADERVGSLVDREPITFRAMEPQDKVVDAFDKYKLVSAAVVDEQNRLVGRITFDDVVDVIRENADHSVMARAGLVEDADIFAPVIRSTKSRALWLGVNLITAIVASWVIGQFEDTIEKLVALAVLMPIVASMGGNAGTQTLTIVIRGLGLGTITQANAWRVLKKELLVGGLNGLIWALAVAAVAVIWYQDYSLGLIIAMAMVINLVVSAAAGVLLPMLLQRIGIDPALAGGVALTTVTDVVGFFALLSLAAVFLL
ncbi:MAG: magnesium transporter [Arenicellales bacterium]|nr:magnesium transporter [Arenicellales bacterium]